MSWLHQLYETYEKCSENPEFMTGDHPLLPICHTTQNAHIEVVLSNQGDFVSARVLGKGELTTIVPCTEGSAGRSGSKPVNHPLCDKLQYVAGDYLDYGGDVTVGFKKNAEEPYQNYLAQLGSWAGSAYSHPKATAIYQYVKKATLMADLVKEKRLYVGDDGQLIKQWKLGALRSSEVLSEILGGQYDELVDKLEAEPNTKKQERIFSDYAPAIFKAVPTTQTIEASLVRWRVETPGIPLSATWEDQSLFQSWIDYYSQRESKKDLCMVTGDTVAMATQHPSGIRHGADKAKLISSNDSGGFTFRGRFTDKHGHQACTVSADVTQKAHNALRWLVQRKQAYRFGDQVFVSWAVSGEDIPDPMANTASMWGDEDEADVVQEESQHIGDVGQAFARRLSKFIAGYSANISDTTHIIVMGLDSATPGRMAVTYYRVLVGSEFLERIRQWHERFAWHQNYSKDTQFIGAPAPRDIAEAAYGRRLDDKLKKATVERLLPCIIDQTPFPHDLMHLCVQRAANRIGMERWEWNKVLGIACSLYRGGHQKESFSMSLEEDRTSRDYLYGRLLAVADYIEEISLSDSEKNRPTNAARFMQRFASRPFQTWPMLYGQIIPYIARIKSNRAGRWVQLDQLLGEIKNKFVADDFTDPAPLTGEYLLAYYCQRKALWTAKKAKSESSELTPESVE